MRVLWVSASAIGPASRILAEKYSGSSGSWIQTIYEEMISETKPDMFFLCFSKSLKPGAIEHRCSEEGEAFRTFMPTISLGRTAPKKVKKAVEIIINKIHPDIIHIWGTETCVQNIVAECGKGIPKVVFIQGIIGIHDRYHNINVKRYGLSLSKPLLSVFRDKLHDSLFHKQIQFEKKEILLAGNVIIDNDFSRAYCESLSEKINYYYYPLNSRSIFSQRKWGYDSCIKNTIFTVYGAAQDKGLFQLIRAVHLVKREFPDVKLLIPGRFGIANNNGRFYGSTAYEKFIAKLINEYGLSKNIKFLGQLSQEEMASELLKAHIFVNPSAMEVHAGSLREAMTTGTPSISSYCGSVSEFVRDGECGFLYRYEEFEVLAQKIKRYFNDRDLCANVSVAEIKEMENRNTNTNGLLMKIYSEIITGNNH